jgi:hypothetical protein
MKVLFLLPLFLLIASTIVLLCLQINVVIQYTLDAGVSDFRVFFFALSGIINYKYNREKTNLTEKENPIQSIFAKIDNSKYIYRANAKSIKDLIKYFKAKLILKKFTLDIEEGTGEAHYTGIVCGLLWTIVGCLSSYLFNGTKTKFVKNQISIRPNFNAEVFAVKLECIFQASLVHIIVILTKVFFIKSKINKFKTSKGGDLYEPTSNRGINDNCYGKYKGNG